MNQSQEQCSGPTAAPLTLWASLKLWHFIGWASFGGPAAQIAMMQEELVEKRRWISPHRFLHALNYCMVLPGPEAQQLATYMGWLTHGPLGGIAAGLLFVLPSLLIMIALGTLYVLYGQMPEVQAMLYGLKPAVLAIVVAASVRLGQKVLHGPLWWAIAAGAFVLLFFKFSFVVVIAVAALTGWLAHLFSKTPLRGLPNNMGTASPANTAYVQSPGEAEDEIAREPEQPGYLIDDHTPSPPHAKGGVRHLATAILTGVAIWAVVYGLLQSYFPVLLTDLAAFFTKVALVTFGGAYAVLPYVFDVVVEQEGWLTIAQMMDGLALGETTPGPLVMVNAFVGFLAAAENLELTYLSIPAAGALGAVVVTFFTFLPSFVFILAGAPWVEASRRIPALIAPLTAVSAAVVAVIVDLGLIFAQHILWPTSGYAPMSIRSLDIVAAIISVLAILLMLVFKVGMIRTMLASIAMGLVAIALGLQ
jgi:chromate transporter